MLKKTNLVTTKKFNKITKEEIQDAYEFQRNSTDWTFYSEREFVENLFSNRFNYLLVVYSLFVTAFAAISGKTNKLIILGLGLFVTILISLTIYRAYIKLIINLKILHHLNEKHVFPMIGKETKAKGAIALWNVNPIIGVVIPIVFIFSFTIAIILISCNYWSF